MPHYKLYYFNGRGRGEVARYLFKMAGVEFEDVRLQGESWQEFKPKTPFGQMPVLEVDGVMICQSTAIERLIAGPHGLYGADDMQKAKSDMVVGCLEDMIQGAFKTTNGSDEEKAEKKKKFEEETLPTMLANLEKMVTADGGFISKDVMWADVAFAQLVTLLDMQMVGPIKYDMTPYTKLTALKTKVESHPKIAAWMKERPETPF